MIVFSFFSFFVSLLVFIGLREIVYLLEPSNLFYANLLIVLIGTAITSFIFTVRQFRGYGKGRFSHPLFQKTLMRTFLINFVILFFFFVIW